MVAQEPTVTLISIDHRKVVFAIMVVLRSSLVLSHLERRIVMSSKLWIVESDSQGLASSARKELVREYDARGQTPGDYSSPIGIVYEHDEKVIHSADSPTKYTATSPIITGVEISNLEGRLLTLVDAAFADLEQRKAFKDMVRETVWRWNGDNDRRVRETFDFLNK